MLYNTMLSMSNIWLVCTRQAVIAVRLNGGHKAKQKTKNWDLNAIFLFQSSTLFWFFRELTDHF